MGELASPAGPSAADCGVGTASLLTGVLPLASIGCGPPARRPPAILRGQPITTGMGGSSPACMLQFLSFAYTQSACWPCNLWFILPITLCDVAAHTIAQICTRADLKAANMATRASNSKLAYASFGHR